MQEFEQRFEYKDNKLSKVINSDGSVRTIEYTPYTVTITDRKGKSCKVKVIRYGTRGYNYIRYVSEYLNRRKVSKTYYMNNLIVEIIYY